MRIAVMGSGAVGGYFGAKLAAAGHELIFIARGAHLAALRRSGLRIASAGSDWLVTDAQFTDGPTQIGNVDLVLFCVKSYDTESAAQSIRPLVGPQTAVLSMQNGVDNPEKLAVAVPPSQILAAVVYVGAQLAAPGVIRYSNGGRIIFGQRDGSASESAKRVEQHFVAAGIPAQLTAEIERFQWTKLLWNASFCAISCLTRANVKEIVESALLTQLVIDCMVEVQAAARTKQIELKREQFDEILAFSRTLGEFKPSMLQDLEANKPLEYDAFNGIVMRQLASAGHTAPINQLFFATLRFLDQRIRQGQKG